MTNAPITIETLEIQGFRAYLQPQSFSLHQGKAPLSLAVFAPNAKGKSSLVDAFEYYFSEDATLARLGQRVAQAQAGPAALEHVRADDLDIESYVRFTFRQGSDGFTDIRRVKGGKNIPTAAQRVRSAIALPFVIHGYELRGFVEGSAEDRYREMASWFSLDPLLTIQKNLRDLQRQIRAKANSEAEINERLRDLKRITTDEVATWNEAEVCAWFSSRVLSSLDASLGLREISETDDGFRVLRARKEAEEQRVGLVTIRKLIEQMETLFARTEQDDKNPSGLLVSFEDSFASYVAAVAHEESERNKASQAVFKDVWEQAHTLFGMEGHDFDACPVCDTVFASTPHQSKAAVQVSLSTKLDELDQYRKAESELRVATQRVANDKDNVIAALGVLCTGLPDAGYELQAQPLIVYRADLTAWATGIQLPDSSLAQDTLSSVHTLLTQTHDNLISQQGENTYARAHAIAINLIRIKDDIHRLERTKAELRRLLTELDSISNSVETAIVNYIKHLFSKLEDDVDRLYQKMQGADGDHTAKIRFELPNPSEANQQRVRLVVDYSHNRKGVAPTGYLSDSQIHTVALALRFAAIRTFNAGAPVIVLDDVVTSYDADHRKNIAATLADEFAGFQILVVTHDEQFFNLLRDHLPQSAWAFRRITNLDPDFGPVFADHHTSDEEIDSKLADGITAGEKIRQAEEEWLLKICREFGVSVRIREIERPYQYDRSELAAALAGFLKEQKLVPPAMPGIANSFLNSLQSGVVENFVSHFSDNPHRSPSVGDERARWTEFKLFRELFICPKCGRSRFSRPWQLKKPVCRNESCQTPFEFQTTLSTAGDPQ